MDSALKNISKTIIITGSNKGIGYTTLKRISSRNPKFNFIMAVRSIENGEKALSELSQSVEGIKERVKIAQLDISDSKSIDNFVEWVSKNYGKVDALINNAGMAFKGDAFGADVVATTFKTNYYGTIELTEKMKNLINDNGKIVIIGSSAGKLSRLTSEELKNRFTDPNLTKEGLDLLAKEFYDRVVDNTYLEKGWPRNSYGMSKLCINTYARLLGKDEEILKRNIQVYVCCPGWCRTDMAGPNAPLSADDGAITPTYLIELPWEINKDLQGQFFYECKVASL